MAIPSFFKQNKPRGFNYTPRYYDPVKEEMEQRRRRWAAEKDPEETGQETQGNEPSPAESTGDEARQPYRSKIMRGDMKNYFPHRQEKIRKQTTIRLLVIILIIVFVIYLYLRF
jgi:hypothetical protein